MLGLERSCMNLINRLTEYFIDNQIISEESKNIYKYGFFVFFYNLFVIINIVIDGILLNEVYFTVVFLLFWIPYRVFIGGIHCSTATRCLCFFNLYYLFALLLYKYLNSNVLICINIMLFCLQFYKESNNLIFIFLWIVYVIFMSLNSQIFEILSVSYICASILKIIELYTNKKYLF